MRWPCLQMVDRGSTIRFNPIERPRIAKTRAFARWCSCVSGRGPAIKFTVVFLSIFCQLSIASILSRLDDLLPGQHCDVILPTDVARPSNVREANQLVMACGAPRAALECISSNPFRLSAARSRLSAWGKHGVDQVVHWRTQCRNVGPRARQLVWYTQGVSLHPFLKCVPKTRFAAKTPVSHRNAVETVPYAYALTSSTCRLHFIDLGADRVFGIHKKLSPA